MVHRIIYLAVFIIFTDLVIYAGLKIYSRRHPFNPLLAALPGLHAFLSLCFMIFAGLFFLANGKPGTDPVLFRKYYLVSDFFMLSYLPKATALCFIIPAMALAFFPGKGNRKVFNYLIISAAILSLLIFTTVIRGFTSGYRDFVIRRVEIGHPDVPDGFDGFRIAHISDLHLGSWKNPDELEKGFRLIQEQGVNLVLLAGDLINVTPSEAYPYLISLKAVHATHGKFAILGNHDVGDYARFENNDLTQRNVKSLNTVYRLSDFSLLRNEHVFLKQGTDSIALLGTDNWSLSHFRRLGRLNDAMQGTGTGFKILMSHDPSHWKAEVAGKADIDLTLSGHTHGMQLGIITPLMRWSPAMWTYPEWLGLYQINTQYLYVTAGMGFLGFSGRIGIRPEVTIITLKKAPR